MCRACRVSRNVIQVKKQQIEYEINIFKDFKHGFIRRKFSAQLISLIKLMINYVSVQNVLNELYLSLFN